ncbi:hypothetical protein [Haloarcula nitratireducens]|uniref:Uncharacterized protein n=1 Tax=Haloarcula nitratireducens TaxID=2487749 RepID=A0AAW4P968_9EURY|nr:hypothetical protein [Halomicroarcula nitratireducens]MBX0293832.1 hypothetical protein [Halomicroarcula nitratireducens]
MDTDRLTKLALNYLVLFVLVFLVLAAVRAIVGDVGFWVEMAIVVVVAFAYRPVVTRLGVAPSGWE